MDFLKLLTELLDGPHLPPGSRPPQHIWALCLALGSSPLTYPSKPKCATPWLLSHPSAQSNWQQRELHLCRRWHRGAQRRARCGASEG